VDSNPSCNAAKLTALYLRQIVHAHKSNASNVTTIQYYKLFFFNSKSTETTTYFDNLQATNIFRFHLVYAFNYKLYPQLLVTPPSANISNAISTRQMLSNCPKSQQSTQYKNKSGDIVAGKKATLENYTTALRLGLMMNW